LSSFEDKLYFKGLPIPGGALTIISFVMFFLQDNYLGSDYTRILAFAVVIIVPLAMVSTIKFDNFPRPSLKSFKTNPIMFIGVIFAFIAGYITKGMSVFPTMMLYIIVATTKHFIAKISRISSIISSKNNDE
jgi:phosphatidylserine synthase